MNATSANNQTSLSANDATFDLWDTDWLHSEVTIGFDEILLILLGFSVGSLFTAVCFLSALRCKRKKQQNAEENEEDDDIT